MDLHIVGMDFQFPVEFRVYLRRLISYPKKMNPANSYPKLAKDALIHAELRFGIEPGDFRILQQCKLQDSGTCQ